MRRNMVMVVAVMALAGLIIAGCQEKKDGVTQPVQMPEAVQQATQKAAAAVEQVAEKVQETAAQVTENVQQTASQAVQSVQEAVAPATAASAADAIKQSEGMQSVQEKVNFLIGQAESLYGAKEFQQVVDIAQYILGSLDANSSPAQSLLEKAKQGLQAAAQSAVSGAVQQLNPTGQAQ